MTVETSITNQEKLIVVGPSIVTTSKNGQGMKDIHVADYEVYDQRAANPENATVDIFVGIN